MQDANPRETPFPANTVLQQETDPTKLLNPEKASRYQAIVGSIGFLVHCTRPKLPYAHQRLSKFLAKPGLVHLDAAHHVLQYLKVQRNLESSSLVPPHPNPRLL